MQVDRKETTKYNRVGGKKQQNNVAYFQFQNKLQRHTSHTLPDLPANYYRFQLRGDLLFGDIFYRQKDQDETWAQGFSACDLIFPNMSYNQKYRGLAMGV